MGLRRFLPRRDYQWSDSMNPSPEALISTVSQLAALCSSPC
jgi:hypothetical protein